MQWQRYWHDPLNDSDLGPPRWRALDHLVSYTPHKLAYPTAYFICAINTYSGVIQDFFALESEDVGPEAVKHLSVVTTRRDTSGSGLKEVAASPYGVVLAALFSGLS